MKVLLLNGSPHEKGCTYTALSEVAQSLAECQVDSEIAWIGAQPVRGCIGCGGCAGGPGALRRCSGGRILFAGPDV